jgi:carbon-monoxide dehydrogenase medium subunit
VKPAPFAYARARSIEHAIALLGEADADAKLLAGGQSLIASLNMRLSAPSLLVDINGVPGLDTITVKDGHVTLGALVRHAQAEHSADIARHAPLIARAIPSIAHVAIRNRGTICGSLAFADPAAELPACMVALDAEFRIKGPNGERSVKAADFFKGMFETALAPHDILVSVSFPAATANTRVGFAELARRLGDYAMVGLAASAQSRSGGYDHVRLVFFGVGDRPVRASKAEAALASGAIDQAVEALAGELDPPSDLQASGKTKLHLAGVLVRRVAAQLAEQRS